MEIIFKRAVAAEEGGDPAVSDRSPGKEDGNPTVTYGATKVSLFDALQSVAELGGYEIWVEPFVATIAKPLAGDELITREWRLPPMALEKLEGKQAKLGPAKRQVMAYDKRCHI